MHTHNVCNICIGEQSLIYHVPGIIGTHCQVISFGPYLEKITSILSTLISQIVSTMSGYSFWALSGGRLRLCQTQLCPTLRASTCRLSHDDNKGKWLDKNDDKIGIAYFFIDFLSHFNLFRFFLCAFWFQLFCSFNWFGCCAESLLKSTMPSSASAPSHSRHSMFHQKYTLLMHTSFHTKVKKIENTFLITFQIPLLSIGIMYKLQHDRFLHAEHANIFKATLRSFSAGEVKTYSLYGTGVIKCVMCRAYIKFTKKMCKKTKNRKAYHKSLKLCLVSLLPVHQLPPPASFLVLYVWVSSEWRLNVFFCGWRIWSIFRTNYFRSESQSETRILASPCYQCKI